MITSKMRQKLEKRKEQLAKKGGGKIPYFLVKEGVNRMRLLPAPPEKEFAIEATFFYISREIGGLVSPVTFNEPCAIMELYTKLKSSKNEEDRELAKKMSPKKRYFAMHYKYQDEKGKVVDFESGAKLTILTNSQYQDLIDLYLDEEAGDMTDPKNGYDIKYKRTGTGQFDTEYTTMRCNSTPINKKFAGKIYDPAVELKKIIPSYEETQNIASQIFSDTPKTTDGVVRKKKKKKKVNRDI